MYLKMNALVRTIDMYGETKFWLIKMLKVRLEEADLTEGTTQSIDEQMASCSASLSRIKEGEAMALPLAFNRVETIAQNRAWD